MIGREIQKIYLGKNDIDAVFFKKQIVYTSGINLNYVNKTNDLLIKQINIPFKADDGTSINGSIGTMNLTQMGTTANNMVQNGKPIGYTTAGVGGSPWKNESETKIAKNGSTQVLYMMPVNPVGISISSSKTPDGSTIYYSGQALTDWNTNKNSFSANPYAIGPSGVNAPMDVIKKVLLQSGFDAMYQINSDGTTYTKYSLNLDYLDQIKFGDTIDLIFDRVATNTTYGG